MPQLKSLRDNDGRQKCSPMILIFLLAMGLVVQLNVWLREWSLSPSQYAPGNSQQTFPVTVSSSSKGVFLPLPNTIEQKYVPSKIESYFLDHGRELGLGETPSSGCSVWNDPNSPIAAELLTFRAELRAYQGALASFLQTRKQGEGTIVQDLRKEILSRGDHSICDTLDLHPLGLTGLFPSRSLTQTSHSLLEPIFPPMRTPEYCDALDETLLVSMDYLVHDFATYCRQLSPLSRIVFLDMGASLEYHGSGAQPAIYLTEIYHAFGFHFDHIYAYEMTHTDPNHVVEMVPAHLRAAYHWINVGVSQELDSKRNPWTMLLQEFNEHDFGQCRATDDVSAPFDQT